MNRYETIEIVGEGSYGIVMKCRHRDSGQIVAIKKCLETEEDVHVRKMAFREIRMLKKLRHENLVNLIEVIRRRKRFYLVFEYLDHTVLDELEKNSSGLGLQISRRHIYQLLRGLSFCHANHIMHRDVKPENVLVSPNGVIKLCDFGFARFVTVPNESCTDYVATRWYRAPELLVGDRRYGKQIDVWALGCLYAEMATGEPLFPGESDLDQLYQITRLLGNLCGKQQAMIARGNNTRILRRTSADEFHGTSNASTLSHSLQSLFPKWTLVSTDFLSQCLQMDPELRSSCSKLLQHPLFTRDCFAEQFLQELHRIIAKETSFNPLFLKKTESRFFQGFRGAEESKFFYGSAERWQMHLIKGSRSIKSDTTTDNSQTGNIDSVQDAPGTDRPSGSLTSAISKVREPLNIGSISVIPNTSYMNRMEHNRGTGISSSTSKPNFSSPALSLRDNGVKRALNVRRILS